MTTKHQPATALPWHVGVRQAERIIYDACGWAVANATVYHGASDAEEVKRNAAYIAHAANKYPELVAALRIALLEPISAEAQMHIGNVLESLGELP